MQVVIPKLSPLPTVAVVGLGNIGSQLIDALGRIRQLKRVVLIDPDVYSVMNIESQRISRRDVRKSKAAVQAKRLAEINPDLEVIPIIDFIANVPRGLLRGAVVNTALDSAEARRDACEAAWRVGAPVIDGGVDPELGLGRVSVYVPAAGAPCFECALEAIDYQNMPAKHVCGPDMEEVNSTRGSPSLGALVGSWMTIETAKLLAGQSEGSLAGCQLVMDVTHHKQFLTRLHRCDSCRFDHACRDLRELAGVTAGTTLADALAAVRAALGSSGKPSLGVDGHEFARALHCPGCGATKELFALPERLPLKARTCTLCAGREMIAIGFKKLARIGAADVPARVLRRTLRALGIRAGDVLMAGDDEQTTYFEVAHE